MRRFLMFLVGLVLLLCGTAPASAQDQMEFPPEVRGWYYNFTRPGSCVQCSIGMAAVWQNCPQASTLLWNTEYGSPEHHGSGPGRVQAYAERRGIPCWNVTGSNTWEWMEWACSTGRMAAIGAGGSHFQTLVWKSPDPNDSKPWKVCNNNSPNRIDEYNEQGFRRLHLASGQWVVILKTPPPPAKPQYVEWWKK